MMVMGQLASTHRVVAGYSCHVWDHPDVVQLLPAALETLDPSGREFFVEEVDFGRLIGKSACVRTGREDRILFADRENRGGPSRFVIDRQEEPCSCLMVILAVSRYYRNQYHLITAFVGRKAAREPWDARSEDEHAECVQFWDEHALVYGSQPCILGSARDKAPEYWEMSRQCKNGDPRR